MILNVAVGYDDYLTDKNAFCNNKECLTKSFQINTFLIDWIEYKNFKIVNFPIDLK